MTADTWATIAFIIVTFGMGVWAAIRRLQEKLATQTQGYTEDKIRDSEARAQEKLADRQRLHDQLERRVSKVEEDRHKDMLEILDRMTKEIRASETAAHQDRLRVVEALGEVKGAIQLTNQSADRAHKDIGGINSTLHGLEEKVAALVARQDEKDIETVAGKR